MRTAFEQGHALHMVPVAWTSVWMAALVPAGHLVGGDAGWRRAASACDTPRPPTPTIAVRAGTDPRRPRRRWTAGQPADGRALTRTTRPDRPDAPTSAA